MKRAHFGYSEPLRRFIQHEGFTPQVNEIRNQMPSWIPGEDHLINFQKGDPYVKVDEGYARLPGAGYEALHPELEGLDPEDYPDITKLSILGDVGSPYPGSTTASAPSSRSSHTGILTCVLSTNRLSSRFDRPRSRRCRCISAASMHRWKRSRGRSRRLLSGGIELAEYPRPYLPLQFGGKFDGRYRGRSTGAVE